MLFKTGEREYLVELRYLTTDIDGRDVFAGLSHAESEEYHALSQPGAREFQRGETSEEHRNRRTRYVELHEKMELARLQTIGAEIQRRGEPTLN